MKSFGTRDKIRFEKDSIDNKKMIINIKRLDYKSLNWTNRKHSVGKIRTL